MPYNPDIHHRHSIRLKDYDYAQAGAYFVTICAWQRECLFGEIVDGLMVLNDLGRIVDSVWRRLPEHFTSISLDEFIILPNHFHGILQINESVGAKQASPALPSLPGLASDQTVGATAQFHRASPALDTAPNQGKAVESLALPLHGTVSGSLCAVVQNFKSVSTRKINKLRDNPGCQVWQRNYYERVIRNDDELSRAREYVVNNPMKWELDRENPIHYP